MEQLGLRYIASVFGDAIEVWTGGSDKAQLALILDKDKMLHNWGYDRRLHDWLQAEKEPTITMDWIVFIRAYPPQ